MLQAPAFTSKCYGVSAIHDFRVGRAPTLAVSLSRITGSLPLAAVATLPITDHVNTQLH